MKISVNNIPQEIEESASVHKNVIRWLTQHLDGAREKDFMNKSRVVFFCLLVFFPLEIVTPFAFQLALSTADDLSFRLSLLMILGSGAVSIPWALMWVNVIRRLYGNMDAYLFDGDSIALNVFDEYFTDDEMVLKYLSFWEYLRLRLFGELYLFTKKKEGWASAHRFYITNCSVHNLYFLDYKQGYKEIFHCPKCLAEKRVLK